MKDRSNGNYHRLLRRQLGKVELSESDLKDKPLEKLITLVDASYRNFDEERRLHERAEQISSHELKEINLALQEKNRFLDSFNHGLAHDAKNHTANLKGLLKMFTKYNERQDREKVDQISRKLERSVNQMTSLLDGFLYLSSEGKELEANKELIDLETLKTGIQLEIDYLYDETKHEVVMNFNIEDLYYSTHIVKVILVNLISNSLKFSKSDSKNKVVARLSKTDAALNISVSDTGMGMDLNDETTTMFKLFDRRSNAKQIKGYGVGLYLIKNILDRNGGFITIDSELRVGTTIQINLPLIVK